MHMHILADHLRGSTLFKLEAIKPGFTSFRVGETVCGDNIDGYAGDTRRWPQEAYVAEYRMLTRQGKARQDKTVL